MKTIKTLGELKRLARKELFECAITLNGGLISRKYIFFDGKHFFIENCIDDSSQKLTKEELFDESLTNIGKALTLGALVIT